MELMTLITIGMGLLTSGWLLFTMVGRWSKVKDPSKPKNLKRSAISIPNAGGFDRLCLTDSFVCLGANIPNCKPGIYEKIPTETLLRNKEVYAVVEIHSIGVNYADCCIRWGLYASAKEYVGWPITPGFEFAGKVIEIIGEDQKNNHLFKKGDQVFGVTLFGAYSTHVVVPIRQIFHKPKKLNMDEAGGFLCTGITAYYALFELGGFYLLPHVKSLVHQKIAEFYQLRDVSQVVGRPPVAVLIHSASGGVGSMLIQLCKRIAQIEVVVGVVGGEHKVELAKKLGCDYVINRKDKSGKEIDIWKEMKKQIPNFEGFDIVFDANGVSTLKNSYEHLKSTGKLIVYGSHSILPHDDKISIKKWINLGYDMLRTPNFKPMDIMTNNRGVLGFNLSFLFTRRDRLEEAMSNMLTWIDQGKLTVSKVTTYKMEEVWKSHRDLQSGDTTGKLVLQTIHHSNRITNTDTDTDTDTTTSNSIKEEKKKKKKKPNKQISYI